MDFSESIFEKKLMLLKDSQDVIQKTSAYCMANKKEYKKIIHCWMKCVKKAKIAQRLSMFYLANDVIQACKRKNYRDIVDYWASHIKQAVYLVTSHKVRDRILRIFTVWESRTIYDDRFMKELRDILTMRNSEEDRNKIMAEFQPRSLFERIRTVILVQMDVEKKSRELRSLKFDSLKVEQFHRGIKDRREGDHLVCEFEEGVRAMEGYVEALEKELEERNKLIKLLEKAYVFYEGQKGEVKVVFNAYKNYAGQVKSLKKKLDALLPTIKEISPIPSPDVNAPSPSPDHDLRLPTDEEKTEEPMTESFLNTDLQSIISQLISAGDPQGVEASLSEIVNNLSQWQGTSESEQNATEPEQKPSQWQEAEQKPSQWQETEEKVSPWKDTEQKQPQWQETEPKSPQWQDHEPKPPQWQDHESNPPQWQDHEPPKPRQWQDHEPPKPHQWQDHEPKPSQWQNHEAKPPQWQDHEPKPPHWQDQEPKPPQWQSSPPQVVKQKSFEWQQDSDPEIIIEETKKATKQPEEDEKVEEKGLIPGLGEPVTPKSVVALLSHVSPIRSDPIRESTPEKGFQPPPIVGTKLPSHFPTWDSPPHKPVMPPDTDKWNSVVTPEDKSKDDVYPISAYPSVFQTLEDEVMNYEPSDDSRGESETDVDHRNLISLTDIDHRVNSSFPPSWPEPESTELYKGDFDQRLIPVVQGSNTQQQDSYQDFEADEDYRDMFRLKPPPFFSKMQDSMEFQLPFSESNEDSFLGRPPPPVEIAQNKSNLKVVNVDMEMSDNEEDRYAPDISLPPPSFINAPPPPSLPSFLSPGAIMPPPPLPSLPPLDEIPPPPQLPLSPLQQSPSTLQQPPLPPLQQPPLPLQQPPLSLQQPPPSLQQPPPSLQQLPPSLQQPPPPLQQPPPPLQQPSPSMQQPPPLLPQSPLQQIQVLRTPKVKFTMRSTTRMGDGASIFSEESEPEHGITKHDLNFSGTLKEVTMVNETPPGRSEVEEEIAKEDDEAEEPEQQLEEQQPASSPPQINDFSCDLDTNIVPDYVSFLDARDRPPEVPGALQKEEENVEKEPEVKDQAEPMDEESLVEEEPVMNEETTKDEETSIKMPEKKPDLKFNKEPSPVKRKFSQDQEPLTEVRNEKFPRNKMNHVDRGSHHRTRPLNNGEARFHFEPNRRPFFHRGGGGGRGFRFSRGPRRPFAPFHNRRFFNPHRF